MKRSFKAFRLEDDGTLSVLDQRLLPFEKRYEKITSVAGTIEAIKEMTVRGAGVIGNVAAFGVYFASKESDGDLESMEKAARMIKASRPTAVNLMWAVDKMVAAAKRCEAQDRSAKLLQEALRLCNEEAAMSEAIGRHGADLIERIMDEKGLSSIDVLTHCNAGWLAIVDDGSALAPIYEAKRRGIDIHVWVDETRPRNQGANLTAWELTESGIPHTIIADNTGGYLMSRQKVDLCITGADRVARNGDTANKIGTYLKALAAYDNDIPFFVALPSSTFDFSISNGDSIPIETRGDEELRFIRGIDRNGVPTDIKIYPDHSKALNYGFDVTPARLITGLITERGICAADSEAIETLYKDLA